MIIKSKAYPLPIENIDTDQIIPAKFLKQVDKKGYGKNLFYNWRYAGDYERNQEFVLNDSRYAGASILLAGNNFGCGSSREHAAWAVADFGLKAIISTQFADIFKGNAYNNGILPVTLSKKNRDALMQACIDDPETVLEVDLSIQRVTCEKICLDETFEIHPFKKQCLMEGKDETEYLLSLRPEIEAFEKQLI
ncbi:MAG: 3-isopropylmalate dehydratase small subunit [Bacteroidota bacterium]